jgi:hypothetical protein
VLQKKLTLPAAPRKIGYQSFLAELSGNSLVECTAAGGQNPREMTAAQADPQRLVDRRCGTTGRATKSKSEQRNARSQLGLSRRIEPVGGTHRYSVGVANETPAHGPIRSESAARRAA